MYHRPNGQIVTLCARPNSPFICMHRVLPGFDFLRPFFLANLVMAWVQTFVKLPAALCTMPPTPDPRPPHTPSGLLLPRAFDGVLPLNLLRPFLPGPLPGDTSSVGRLEHLGPLFLRHCLPRASLFRQDAITLLHERCGGFDRPEKKRFLLSHPFLSADKPDAPAFLGQHPESLPCLRGNSPSQPHPFRAVLQAYLSAAERVPCHGARRAWKRVGMSCVASPQAHQDGGSLETTRKSRMSQP